ncbi:MAG: SCO family protein [bacterium]|nr:SCO family protein [bacterium]
MKRSIFIVLCIAAVVGAVLVGKIFILNSSPSPEVQVQEFDNPAVDHLDVAGKRVVNRVALLKPKKAFDFNLTNMGKTSTALNDFKGKVVLVGFLYTSCPDVCGILTMHFRKIQEEFKDVLEKDLSLVLITTDPKRDNPERLTTYTKGFGGKWHFLTGTEEQLKKTWKEYKVFVRPKEEADIVYHTYMIALIDREGYIRYRYVGLVDPKEVIIKDLKKVINS